MGSLHPQRDTPTITRWPISRLPGTSKGSSPTSRPPWRSSRRSPLGQPLEPPTWMKDNGAMDGGNYEGRCPDSRAHALLSRQVRGRVRQARPQDRGRPPAERAAGTKPDTRAVCGPQPSTPSSSATILGPNLLATGRHRQDLLGTMSNRRCRQGRHDHHSTVTADTNAMPVHQGVRLQVEHDQQRFRPEIAQSAHRADRTQVRQLPLGHNPRSTRPTAEYHAYAVESWVLIRDWIQSGVNSYSAWNMVLDTGRARIRLNATLPQNALLTGEHLGQDCYPDSGLLRLPPLLSIRRPGAKVVGTTGGDAIAFKNPDGTIHRGSSTIPGPPRRRSSRWQHPLSSPCRATDGRPSTGVSSAPGGQRLAPARWRDGGRFERWCPRRPWIGVMHDSHDRFFGVE